MTTRRNRIPKTIHRKMADLDAHAYILRLHGGKIGENISHLKIVLGTLRALICHSSQTEGLLWRLTKELQVCDIVSAWPLTKIDAADPIAQHIELEISPLRRQMIPNEKIWVNGRSLKSIVKTEEPIFVSGKRFTFEKLIIALSQQIGLSHEDEGVEPALAILLDLNVFADPNVALNLRQLIDFTLEICERVFLTGHQKLSFTGSSHDEKYGDLSLFIVLEPQRLSAKHRTLIRFSSQISLLTVDFSAEPDALYFKIVKEDVLILSLKTPPLGVDKPDRLCAVFSYSSRKRVARTISNLESSSPIPVDLGWIFASDTRAQLGSLDREVLKKNSHFGVMEALMSPADAQRFSQPIESGSGILVTSEYLDAVGPFPP